MLGNNYNVAYDEDVLNSSIRKVFFMDDSWSVFNNRNNVCHSN